MSRNDEIEALDYLLWALPQADSGVYTALSPPWLLECFSFPFTVCR